MAAHDVAALLGASMSWWYAALIAVTLVVAVAALTML
jgi:hypothetical protein